MPANAPSLPAPIAAFLSSPLYKNQVQDILARREAQRRTIAFSDAHKLDRISLDVLSQAARDAFRASEAMSDVNTLRNRYSDIVPYDATRVQLGGRLPNEAYLNASWLHEPAPSQSSPKPRAWIASQAPTPETIHDFLSLFLNKPEAGSSNSSATLPKSPPKVILMLTACRESGREKSARYWPKHVGDTSTFLQYVPNITTQSASRYDRPEAEWKKGPQPNISVTFVSSTPSSKEDESSRRGWRTNELLLESGEESTTIHQIEYLGWQDHGVPESTHEVLKLLKHVGSLLARTGFAGESSPLVTHCSAGVGRTGSFIAIAFIVRILKDLQTKDFSSISTLQGAIFQSPLGPPTSLPVPSVAYQSRTSRIKQHGLLPSFLQKDDKQAKQEPNGSEEHNNISNKLDFVMAVIDNLRDQRTTMVQTSKQVEFVYEVAEAWWEENAK